MVLAVNMIDEVELSGNMIDDQELSKQLGITALPISAMRNKGIKQLIEEIDRTVKNNNKPIFVDFCSGEIHRAVHAIAHFI